jgi:hypothetical protein
MYNSSFVATVENLGKTSPQMNYKQNKVCVRSLVRLGLGTLFVAAATLLILIIIVILLLLLSH